MQSTQERQSGIPVEKGKWQGWTGQVYCGRKFGVQEPGHNGLCGPNNGPPCPECFVELMYAK